jgi:dipeptidyl aminopeptidase/acylaminoacyl peptidase
MKATYINCIVILLILMLAGCGRQPRTLTEARGDFQTNLVKYESSRETVPTAPPSLFQTIRYTSPAGEMAAYISPDPKDGKRHPAIIWIFGGLDNSIGETAWETYPSENDQSASAFRKAGIMMMYPSFRGGAGNPGFREGFYGEVNDVLAAADYLAAQSHIDPNRIYLGGHSTGGTLVLLVAASTERFRAAFAFGPVADISEYGARNLPFDFSDKREIKFRSPVKWLGAIRNPAFVFEGRDGNFDSFELLKRTSENPLIQFCPLNQGNHFNILAPMTRLIAQKIIADDGAETGIAFAQGELANIP